jgi:hypothetical protein
LEHDGGLRNDLQRAVLGDLHPLTIRESHDQALALPLRLVQLSIVLRD